MVKCGMEHDDDESRVASAISSNTKVHAWNEVKLVRARTHEKRDRGETCVEKTRV